MPSVYHAAMSTTDVSAAIAGCRPTDGTPVDIEAEALASTGETYLQTLKRDLDDAGYVPATLVVDADFSADCSLTTQAEAERVREYLRVADFLGAGTVRLEVSAVADDGKVRPAVDALRERAAREGLTLVVRGPAAHSL